MPATSIFYVGMASMGYRTYLVSRRISGTNKEPIWAAKPYRLLISAIPCGRAFTQAYADQTLTLRGAFPLMHSSIFSLGSNTTFVYFPSCTTIAV